MLNVLHIAKKIRLSRIVELFVTRFDNTFRVQEERHYLLHSVCNNRLPVIVTSANGGRCASIIFLAKVLHRPVLFQSHNMYSQMVIFNMNIKTCVAKW
jgi:hypothetical protein